MTTPGSYGPGEQPPGGTPGWGQPAGGPPPGQYPPGQYPPGQYPPQGQYPPPQNQPPPGQFPQGQYPGPQGQYPPAQYPQPGQAWGPGAPQKSGNGKWIAIGSGILVAIVVLVLLTVSFGSPEPDPGDCVSSDGVSLNIVDCDDATAQYRFLGTQSNKQTYQEYIADPSTCSEFPNTIQYFWAGDTSDATEKGEVYCLGTI
jgi:hypothetical protein